MTYSETIAPAAGQYHSDLPAEDLIAQINHLRREKNAVILAHNYQIPPIQDLADFTGDSLGLSVEAAEADAERIVFCGVHFMAESAKILSPGKQVFLPHLGAGCSLADSITPESLDDWKADYPDHTVVTYVNSTAEVKAESDICCTSANAVSVVRSLDSDKILFTPDRNLGRWVAEQVPEKEVVVYDGACPTHDVLRAASVERTRTDYPEAVIIAHPECREDVVEIAHEVCSTTGMLKAVEKYPRGQELHHCDGKRHVAPTPAALPTPRVRCGGRVHWLPATLSLHENHRSARRVLFAALRALRNYTGRRGD